MAGVRKCKICGKEYPYCQTPNPTGAFIWKDVGCCVEHAEEYLAQVLAARAGNAVTAMPAATEAVEAPVETDLETNETIEDAIEIDNELTSFKPKKRH